jgi:hypothetical protein
VGLERGPLSLMSIIEEITAVGIRCADHATPLYGQTLALTSPTSSGRSVGIVRSPRSYLLLLLLLLLLLNVSYYVIFRHNERNT